MNRFDNIPQRIKNLNEESAIEISNLIPSLFRSDNQLRKLAEQKLLELSQCNYYHCCLLTLIANESLSEDIRAFCSLSLKNDIDKYWRKDAAYMISDDEKVKIKNEIISLALRLNSEHLFSLITFCISKISRIDFPNSWPSLFNELGNNINNNNESIRLKSIIILNEVVKEISTINLIESKKNFKNLTSKLSDFICQIWSYYIENIFNAIYSYVSGSMDEKSTNACYQHCKPYFKGLESTTSIIYNFIYYGTTSLDNWTNVFYNNLFLHLKKFYSFFEECKNRNIKNSLTETTVHSIRRLIRPIYAGILKHPIDFAKHLEISIDFALSVLMSNNPKLLNSDQIEEEYNYMIISFLTILKLIFDSAIYSKTLSNNPSPEQIEIQNIIYNRYLSIDKLEKLVFVLISNYMILSLEEQQLWDIDPEEFLNCQESDSDGTIKSSAEALLMSILDHDSESCARYAQLIQNILSSTQDYRGDFKKLCVREAAYSAFGWGSYYFYENIDFKYIFNNLLYPEIINPISSKYIVRRLIWVLGRWTEVMDEELRSTIYKTLNEIMNNTSVEDVIRLTIFYSLADFVDDYNFNYAEFEPYIDSFTEQIFQICEGSFEDAKLRLLRFLTKVVPHTQNSTFVTKVFIEIQKMWGQNLPFLIQTSIVNLLKEIILVSNPEFILRELINFSKEVILSGIDPERKGYVYYHEEVLELYKTFLIISDDNQISNIINQSFIQLCEFIFKSIERSSEYILTSTQLIGLHININSELFMQYYAHHLSLFVYNSIGNFKSETMHQVAIIMQTILDAFPNEAVELFRNSILKLIIILIQKDDKETVLCDFSIVLCQALLFKRAIFDQLIQEIALSKSMDVQELFSQFFSRASEYVEQIWSVYHRRLVLLSLYSNFPKSESKIVTSLPVLIQASMQVQNEELNTPYDPQILESPIMKADFFQISKQTLIQVQNTYGQDCVRQISSQLNEDARNWINNY